MPSPNDKLTLKMLAEVTGIPRSTISNWIDTGHMRSRGLMKDNTTGQCHRVRWVYWSDAVPLIERYRPGGNSHKDIQALIPEGHMTVTDAADKLGVDRVTVKKLFRENRLRGVRVPWNGLGTRCHAFIESASVEALVAERGHARKLGFLPAVNTETKHILSANHTDCLIARRELLEKRGIKIKIPVASARKCG